VGVLLGLQGHDQAEFGLFHQLLDEDRGARFGYKDGHSPPCPGHSDIHHAPFLGIRIWLDLGRYKAEQRVVDDHGREAHLGVVGTEDDDVIGLEVSMSVQN